MHDFSISALLIGNIILVVAVYVIELLLSPKFTFGWRRVFDVSFGFWVAVGIFKGWHF